MAYMDSSIQIIGALLLLIGSMYAITKGVKRIVQYYLLARHGITTNARIVGVKEDYSSHELPFVAVVSYTTADGKQMTAAAEEATYIKPILNVELRIIYDPLHPARFYFEKQAYSIMNILMPLLFLGVAILTSVFLLNAF
ncbi:MAG: DUF3592 domain-containing protein [Chitinophagaceae bacterium]|nr:MAG: DUF3592 domain-containing protein [Chitinophagaceae bacterium]